MTPIAPGAQLAQALRTQLAQLRERAPARAAQGGRTEAGGRRPRTVSATMAQRIAAIAPDAPGRPRKAVRIYLEAELAREFGPALLNDPEFPALLDAVQERMEQDADMATAAEALGRLLLAGKARPGA